MVMVATTATATNPLFRFFGFGDSAWKDGSPWASLASMHARKGGVRHAPSQAWRRYVHACVGAEPAEPADPGHTHAKNATGARALLLDVSRCARERAQAALHEFLSG